MKLPHGIRRVFRLGTGKTAEGDLDEELRYHFDRLVEELRADGMDEHSALAEARRRFGDERAYRQALQTIDRGGPRMSERIAIVEVALRNVSFAVRGIRRAPGLAVAVGLVLALGIGANAVMFGVVDRLLLSPPQHVRDADRVRHVYLRRPTSDAGQAGHTLTYPDFEDLKRVEAFESVAAYASYNRMILGDGESSEQVRVTQATASLFPLLGVQPVLGRFFAGDEDDFDAPEVAVLSQEFWERRFGGDPDVLGMRLHIGSGEYEVTGVAPAGFTGAELTATDVWLPLVRSAQVENGTGWRNSRNNWWLWAVVRLRDGVTDAAATAEATAAHRSGRAELIAENRYDPNAELITASLILARGPRPSAEARVALWLAGVSLIVLLIACFNVANLLLARGARVRRELAVRAALGVSRSRMLGERLTESLVLALIGAVGAIAVARWGGRALHQALMPDVAFTDHSSGRRLALFLVVSTLLTALLAGLLPALQATRGDVADALREGGRGVSGSGSTTRRALLVAQAALSAALLVGAGLFVTSLRNAQSTDLGFDPSHVVVVQPSWSGSPPADERQQILEAALERIERLPGIEGAATTFTIPFWSSVGIGRPRIPGLDSFPRHPTGGPYGNKVSDEYFEVMGLTILDGRPLEPADAGDGAAPVAVITQSFADWVWRDQDPIGQCMIFGDGPDAACTTVVGVVENFRRQELVEEVPHLQYFVNQPHPDFQGPSQALMVRTAGRPALATAAIASEVRATSPIVRFAQARPLDRNIAPQLRSWQLGATMFTVFGLLALVVAGWGLYSVLAFDVALRTRELGVRSALGAGMTRIVRLVLRRALWLVALGVTIGLAGALAGARFVEPLLYEVHATEPGVYAAVALVLLAVAGLAGALPALRATRVAPTEALRAD